MLLCYVITMMVYYMYHNSRLVEKIALLEMFCYFFFAPLHPVIQQYSHTGLLSSSVMCDMLIDEVLMHCTYQTYRIHPMFSLEQVQRCRVESRMREECSHMASYRLCHTWLWIEPDRNGFCDDCSLTVVIFLCLIFWLLAGRLYWV